MTRDRPDDEMHRAVDWLRPSDRQLLLEFRRYGGWMKPASVTLNVPYSRQHVEFRCRVLAEHGLLERKAEDIAGYRITTLGEDFLADRLESADLQDTDADDE